LEAILLQVDDLETLLCQSYRSWPDAHPAESRDAVSDLMRRADALIWVSRLLCEMLRDPCKANIMPACEEKCLFPGVPDQWQSSWRRDVCGCRPIQYTCRHDNPFAGRLRDPKAYYAGWESILRTAKGYKKKGLPRKRNGSLC
jgi:hypothetical protein